VRKWTPNDYLKRQNFIPDAKTVMSKKPNPNPSPNPNPNPNRRGWVPPHPW